MLMSIFMINIINIDRKTKHWYTVFSTRMASTRDLVLRTLLTQPRCTITDLAEKVGISPISIRHHIASLEAEGLINSEDERHGVGRPRQVFFLTEIGIEQFPTRYVRLTVRLLEHLKETMPEVMISKLFAQMAEDLARDLSEWHRAEKPEHEGTAKSCERATQAGGFQYRVGTARRWLSNSRS